MHFVRFFVSSSVRSRVVYEGISWFALSLSEADQKWLKKNARFAWAGKTQNGLWHIVEYKNLPLLHFLAEKFAHVRKKLYLCNRKGLRTLSVMEQYLYSVEELRASVEEGTRQIESGQYYTDAQVNRMLEQHHRQLA